MFGDLLNIYTKNSWLFTLQCKSCALEENF